MQVVESQYEDEQAPKGWSSHRRIGLVGPGRIYRCTVDVLDNYVLDTTGHYSTHSDSTDSPLKSWGSLSDSLME